MQGGLLLSEVCQFLLLNTSLYMFVLNTVFYRNGGARLFVDCRFSPLSLVESTIIFLDFLQIVDRFFGLKRLFVD